MLAYKELVDLERALRHQSVLSVFLNGESKDPARRRQWRIDLRNAFDDIEEWLKGSSHSEREAFAACRGLVLERVQSFRGAVGARGWAGFFTTAGAHYADVVPVPMPTMAVWSTGPCVTPYIRAMKEARPVLVGVLDSRKARVFRYVGGKVEFLSTIRARAIVGPFDHLGEPPRAGFHPGTRGTTGTDEAQRELRQGTTQMLAAVDADLSKLAGEHAWIVVGGIPVVASAALGRLSPSLLRRAMKAESLDVHATKAQVAEVARLSAMVLRDRYDLERVKEAIVGAESHRLGATGSVDTRRALEEGNVRELYFTLPYLEDNAADAEAAVRLAFESGALIEHVSGIAAEPLQAVGGIAALLRYVKTPAPELAEAVGA